MRPITASLDRMLASHGQSATLRRRIGTGMTFTELTIRLRLSGYATTDLVGGIKVTDSKFIMSPTPIVAAGVAWPGAAGGTADIRIGDFLFVENRQRAVVQVDNIRIGDVLVRIEGRISG
ncbi:MAG: hypothetical protein J0J10_24270 [Bosea sp.]|uniref:hypothetical protein n=1 Tax=Bosea sp. (in: a-proteobacteria) TaxID=1871050 RepID=UPI001AC1D0E1|nr:hypothetical protein [Bosea sp. (in: a-proteobacteria)]MBN9471890.1 hypothetical protein [Bosea sp. (in: a-proteobacteria)]